MKHAFLPFVTTALLASIRENIRLKCLSIGIGMLLMGVGTQAALAQAKVTINGEEYVIKEMSCKYQELERIRDDLKYCPTFCYTDIVQHTVIECRASGTLDGLDGPLIDREGNYTGPSVPWTITETHDIREISVYEKNCQQTRTETIIEVLGSIPRYYPGDPDIADTRSPYEKPFSNFDCNDYPAETDPVTGELVARAVVDLLIEHKPLFCR
jgi:hypothetical protein